MNDRKTGRFTPKNAAWQRRGLKSLAKMIVGMNPAEVSPHFRTPVEMANDDVRRLVEQHACADDVALTRMCEAAAAANAVARGYLALGVKGDNAAMSAAQGWFREFRALVLSIKGESREHARQKAHAPIEIPRDAVRRLREHQAKRLAGARVLHDGEDLADDTLDEQPDDRKPVFDREAPDANDETPEASVADAAAQRGQDHPPRNAPRPPHAHEPQPDASTRPRGAEEPRDAIGICGIVPARDDGAPRFGWDIPIQPPAQPAPVPQPTRPAAAQPIDPHAQMVAQHEARMRERGEQRRRDAGGKR